MMRRLLEVYSMENLKPWEMSMPPLRITRRNWRKNASGWLCPPILDLVAKLARRYSSPALGDLSVVKNGSSDYI